jgi:hypothetical protein
MSRGAKAFLYIIYFAVLCVLVGLIISSSRSKTIHPTPTPVTQSDKHATKPATKTPANTSSQASSGTTATTNSAGAAANATSTTLSNTGPGDVIGLFAVVSITGSLAYRQLIIRRLRLAE